MLMSQCPQHVHSSIAPPPPCTWSWPGLARPADAGWRMACCGLVVEGMWPNAAIYQSHTRQGLALDRSRHSDSTAPFALQVFRAWEGELPPTFPSPCTLSALIWTPLPTALYFPSKPIKYLSSHPSTHLVPVNSYGFIFPPLFSSYSSSNMPISFLFTV